MSALLRAILIIVLLYLVARSVRALMWPRKKEDRVKGDMRKPQHKIDENRIQDANFKDLPK
jgi:hypothetical protein